ncbi:MAG: Rieske 2Fe-2S domain-containing protein [Planctomycetota bacterium]
MTSRIPASTAPVTGVDATVPSWRDHWFPVAFAQDVPADRPVRVEVWGEAYALFRDGEGQLRALRDRCPHRAARLSDGRVRDGRLECLYHGWRFDGDGTCRHIPQLEAGQAIPAAACARAAATAVRQGIVWLHGGDDAGVDPATIPVCDALERDGCRTIDFAMDLPYAQEFLIENVLDYAHIHIAHDGVRGGGHAALAGPLAFAFDRRDTDGFSAHIGRSADGRLDSGALRAAEVTFEAPGLVHYQSVYERGGGAPRVAGLLLYSLPLDRGRCRLLYRAYSNFWTLRDRLRPRFWEHGHQCHLLEQDMAVVVGQSDNLARGRETLGHAWLPLKSSDALVVAYRSWIDEHDAERPDHLGLRTRGDAVGAAAPDGPIDRWHLHARHCASCRRAVAVAAVMHGWTPVAIVALLAAAALLDGWWRVAAAAAAVVCALGGTALAALHRRLTGAPPPGKPEPPSSPVP